MTEKLKYAFMTFSTPKYTLEENLAAAKKYGYDGIELRIGANHAHGVDLTLTDQERAVVKGKFSEAAISLCALATSLKFADTPNREATTKHCLQVIKLASDLGAPLLRVFGGPLPEGTSREQSINETSQTLKLVLEKAQLAGVTLCFETHDEWCDPKHVKAVLEMVSHPNLGANWDILHPERKGLATIMEAFKILEPWIKHVHIHDCTFNREQDSFAFVPMGEGMVDHRSAIKCLKSMDYQGFISGEWINFQPPEEHLPRELTCLKGYENS